METKNKEGIALRPALVLLPFVLKECKGCVHTDKKVLFRGKPGANARMGVCTPLLFLIAMQLLMLVVPAAERSI